MQLFLKDLSGRTFEAVLLARSRDRMRVGVRDFDDVVELVCSYGVWRTEEGCEIEIGSIIAGDVFTGEIDDCVVQANAAH